MAKWLTNVLVEGSAKATSFIKEGGTTSQFLKADGSVTELSYFDARYLQSYTETDPIFTASPSFGISGTQITNWNTAFGWGDHTGLYESNLGNPTVDGHVLSSTIAGVRSWVAAGGADTLQTVTDRGATTTNGIALNGGDLTMSGTSDYLVGGNRYAFKYISGLYGLKFNSTNVRFDFTGNTGNLLTSIDANTGAILSSSTVTATGGNSTNWNTAFGWGDHTGLYSLLAHTHTISDITDFGTYDNYVSWNLKSNGIQRIAVTSGGDLDLVAGTNMSISYSAGGVMTFNATDTNTQLSQAQVGTHATNEGFIKTYTETDPTVPAYTKTLTTATKLLTEIKTVDGIGSGLNADLLDDEEGAYYNHRVHGIGTNSTNNSSARVQADGITPISSFNHFHQGGMHQTDFGMGYTDGAEGTGSKGGLLNIITHATSVGQIFIGRESKKIYFRDGYQGWSPWVELVHSGNVGSMTTDTNTTYTAGTGMSLVGTTFNNTAPDQTVSLTGGGATSITGTYPNFTISSTDTNTDTNTTYTGGSGITLTGTVFSATYGTAAGTVAQGNDSRINNGQTAFTWGNHSGLYSSTGHTHSYLPLTGGTLSGGLSATILGVDNSSNTSGNGISLYNGAVSGKPAYGLMFSGTATHGTYGGVTGDWATYFTMDGTASRGWVFKHSTTNVASISGTGVITGSSIVKAGGTADDVLLGNGTTTSLAAIGGGTTYIAGTDLTLAGSTFNVTSSTGSGGNTIAKRDSSGDLSVRLIRSEYDSTNATIGYIMTQVDTVSNNYVRPSTPAQFRAAVTDSSYPSNTGTGASGTWGINITGNAGWADQVDVNTSTSTGIFNMLWHSGDTVYGSNGKFTMQPSSGNMVSTGTITATTFIGSLSGNATTATTATTSNLIKVNDYNGTTIMRLLGSHQTGGSDNVYSTAGVTMNCSTNAITATGGFYESSLRKFKKNITPFNLSGLELVSKLEIVTFDRNDSDVKNKIGIIADDSPKEFLSNEEDAVDLYKTIFVQARAIQELNEKVDKQQDQIDELKEMVNKLLGK